MTLPMRPLLSIAILLSLLSVAAAQTLPNAGGNPSGGFGKTDVTGNDLVKVALIADQAAMKPGEPFVVGVHLTVQKDWHIYWKNSGQSGMATVVKLKLPEGFEAGEIQWPRPTVFSRWQDISYGYEGAVVLLVPVKPAASWKGEPVSVEAEVKWLACKDICLKGNATVSSAFAPGAGDDKSRELIEQFQSRVPKPYELMQSGDLQFDGKVLRLTGPEPGWFAASFIPDDTPGVTYEVATVRIKDNVFEVTVPVQLAPQNALGKEMRIAGVLTFGEKPDNPSYEINVPAVPTRQR
jgi:DsbC/DsbD-like thiol-disulfide interchange protein